MRCVSRPLRGRRKPKERTLQILLCVGICKLWGRLIRLVHSGQRPPPLSGRNHPISAEPHFPSPGLHPASKTPLQRPEPADPETAPHKVQVFLNLAIKPSTYMEPQPFFSPLALRSTACLSLRRSPHPYRTASES